MRVLVTGGAGFIGSHLVTLLVEKGLEVVVFDSLVTGKRERIPAGVLFIQGDIRDIDTLSTALEGVTHVAHLAALISVGESMADPLATHAVNVTGMENLLECARRRGLKRVAYASSASVYGDEASLPKKESSPLAPQSPYALSKAINEMQAGMYERTFGLATVGLRIFNVYGPGQSGDHPYASVIPRWIEAMRAGKAITMNGDGSVTRDFVHVRDVVEAMYQALTTEATGVFNIASGKETSLTDLAGILAGIHPKGFEITHRPFREGDVLRSVADISAARRILTFEPMVTLNEGIKELFTL